MDVSSTTAVLDSVREQLLTFVPINGNPTLAVQLGTSPGADDGKLFVGEVPDNVKYPYGVLVMQPSQQGGDDGHFGQRATIELQLLHRPRRREPELQMMADTAIAAMRKWSFLSDTEGQIVSRGGITKSITKFSRPADREVILAYLLIPIYYYPTYL